MQARVHAATTQAEEVCSWAAGCVWTMVTWNRPIVLTSRHSCTRAQASDELDRQRKRADEAEVQLVQLQARVTNMVAAQAAATAAADAESQPALVAATVPAAKGAGTDGTSGNEDGASDTEVRAALEAAREQVASLQASSARIPRLVQALHDTQEQRDELQVRHHGIMCIVAPPLIGLAPAGVGERG